MTIIAKKPDHDKQPQMSVLEFFQKYSTPATWMRPDQAAVLAQISMDKCAINMVLHCPFCGVQHIDRPDDLCSCGCKAEDHDPLGEGTKAFCYVPGCECQKYEPWTNPPHRKHLCKREDGGCGCTFQPALIYTNGVKEL